MSNVEKKEPPFNLEEKIAQIANAISQNEENQSSELANPKIQRVPKHIRERDVELHPYFLLAAASTTHDGGKPIFSHHNLHDLPKHQNKVATRYYTPKMISIGPMHHQLQLGEEYKLRWTAKYVKEMALNIKQLYQEIKTNIGGLKELFTEEVIGDYGDDDYLSWMLFVDGCSLLYFMKHYDENHDPERNLGIKYDQLIYISRDLILLENQLPYQLLVLLNRGETRLLEIMKKYVVDIIEGRQYCGKADGRTPALGPEHTALTVQQPSKPPIHLLDFVRTEILHRIGQEENQGNKDQEPNQQRQQQSEVKKQENLLLSVVQECILGSQTHVEPTYKNIRDLKAANIEVKKAKPGHGISYEQRFLILGDLRIPAFRVDDSTAVIVLNVIALEMCPDFRKGYEVSSFVAFLKSIINDAEDVRLLRKASIINNVLGSDEEVAQLFNFFSSDLVVKDIKYFVVKQQIELHYRHKVRSWIAEFLYNHFSTPWTLGAFSAAVSALALSGIQAYFSAFPVLKKPEACSLS